MKIKRIILSIVVSLLLLSTVALAKTSEYKLQLFFQFSCKYFLFCSMTACIAVVTDFLK